MSIDYYLANNKKYYVSVTNTLPLDGYAYVSLFNDNGEVLLKDIKSSYDIGGIRAAVSNDGKLFATAAYSRKGVDLRDSNGDLVWNTKEIKKVQGLAFSSNGEYLYVWNGDEPEHTYYVRILDGEIEKRIVASWIKPNNYSDDLIFDKQNSLIIGGKKVKSPSFAYLDAVTTKEGIIVSPVGKDLMMYDYNGNLKWVSNFVKDNEYNHIIQLFQDENYLYGLSLDHTVYRINTLSGDCESIKNNIKFIINNKTYIDINDNFIKDFN